MRTSEALCSVLAVSNHDFGTNLSGERGKMDENSLHRVRMDVFPFLRPTSEISHRDPTRASVVREIQRARQLVGAMVVGTSGWSCSNSMSPMKSDIIVSSISLRGFDTSWTLSVTVVMPRGRGREHIPARRTSIGTSGPGRWAGVVAGCVVDLGKKVRYVSGERNTRKWEEENHMYGRGSACDLSRYMSRGALWAERALYWGQSKRGLQHADHTWRCSELPSSLYPLRSAQACRCC